MTGSAFVLLHSPLVGPLTWRGVADELTRREHRTHLPDLRHALAGDSPYYRRLPAAVAEHVDTEGPVVLAAHSGAGTLVPAVVRALRVPVTGAVFVDALLPHPGRSWFDTAPAELAAQLRELAVDGLLPPWDTWFPPGTLDALVPDAELRGELVAELPHVPLAYFDETAPDVPGWQPQRCAYLRLSDGYAAAAAEAAELGWRVDELPAGHLATVTRSARVADLLVSSCGAARTTSR